MAIKSVPILICPNCGGPLTLQEIDQCSCEQCGRDYPVTLGIPDLRPPEFIVKGHREVQVVEKLLDIYPSSDHLSLIKTFFSELDNSQVPKHLVSFYQEHLIHQVNRGAQFTEMFIERLEGQYPLPDYRIACEIGCGIGAGLLALSKHFDFVIGIDPDLATLIVAKKLCEQYHLENLLLIQAIGQKLPFQANSLSYITAQNTLEHIFEVDQLMQEFARVLKKGGCFTADSRNRYDLFFPEPHVKLRWVGFLPRRWANAYVHWRIGMDYMKVHAQLLSYWDLRRALQRSFPNRWRILYPKASAYGGSKRIDSLIDILSNLPGIAQAGLMIFPSHLALAQKQ